MRHALFLAAAAAAAWAQGYKQAPEAIRRILDAPPPPQIVVNPAATHALFLQGRRYPPVAELAQPMLRLAGLRINPRNNGPHRATFAYGLALKRLDTGAEIPVAPPQGVRIHQVRWSPDGAMFAFSNATETAVELWLGRAADGSLRKLSGVTLNAVRADTFQWWGNGALLALTVPNGRGPEPVAGAAPAGPAIQESSGGAGPVRTYQDMLANAHDEALFEHYATAQPVTIDVASGRVQVLGKPALYSALQPAPDGRHLLIAYHHRPFSYVLPMSSFPEEMEVWDSAGKVVKKLASMPMRDRVPIDGVQTGPRQHHWRPTAPATVVWVEALDGGDPKSKAPHRDRVMTWAAPFAGEPAEAVRVEHRYTSLRWLEDGRALITDTDRDRRWTRTQLANFDDAAEKPRLLWERNQRDRYRDRGTPVARTLANGHRAVVVNSGAILLDGLGASPQGDRPFLDRFDLATGRSERLWQCDASSFETVSDVLDTAGRRFITRRESPTDPPNYFLRAAGGAAPVALTRQQDPAPELRQVSRQLVKYKRADGVDLSFTLYLPPGYQAGTPLPTVVWAYPLEFNDPATAGQVSGSTRRFTLPAGPSHLFYLLAGYAILDNAAMPVIGDPETVNNNYLEQIVMSARAAIAKAAEMGVTDPKRVGVGGHSYGAFMTANLLANSDLFRAGVARSGAYNRTLTPFGFQSERRTFWEAPDTYLRMSPFMKANQINEPLLLIHGEADNNQGTFPVQSERMYQAVRGNGGTVRLVMLPYESHGYEGRESVEHTIAEMIGWFDRHVKGAR